MRYTLIIALFTFTSCYSQVNKTLVDNWHSYAVPTNRDSLKKYSWSQNDWAVFIKDGNVNAKKQNRHIGADTLPFKIDPKVYKDAFCRGKISVIRVDDGYLAGNYRGEWGGDLYWFSDNGKKYYKISDDEVVQFIKRDNQIYAIQGLAHLGMSEGSIIKIEKSNNKWIAIEYLKLPTAPEAIALDKDKNFIIITSKSLLKIGSLSHAKFLIEKGMWYYLYPTSMVIKDNIVYSGMRAGIFRYNLATGEQKWLMDN
ncbi:MAG TPA: hypothetical protein VG367_05885 [Mucilaginibacter sp.]|jgi:hypothetical protein|nr:hypothetical protein [Mucilaginibacter sp.]